MYIIIKYIVNIGILFCVYYRHSIQTTTSTRLATDPDRTQCNANIFCNCCSVYSNWSRFAVSHKSCTPHLYVSFCKQIVNHPKIFQVQEFSIDYTQCKSSNNQPCAEVIGGNRNLTCHCSIPFVLTEDFSV